MGTEGASLHRASSPASWADGWHSVLRCRVFRQGSSPAQRAWPQLAFGQGRLGHRASLHHRATQAAGSWLAQRALAQDVFSCTSVSAQPAVGWRSAPTVQQPRSSIAPRVVPAKHSVSPTLSVSLLVRCCGSWWCIGTGCQGRKPAWSQSVLVTAGLVGHAGVLCRIRFHHLLHSTAILGTAFIYGYSMAQLAWPRLAVGQGRLGHRATLHHWARFFSVGAGASGSMRSRQLVDTACFVTGSLLTWVLRCNSRQLVGEERQQCNSYNAIAPRVVQARGWYHSFHQFACLCDMVVNGHRMVWSQAGLAPVGSGAQGASSHQAHQCLRHQADGWHSVFGRRRSSKPLRAACLCW